MEYVCRCGWMGDRPVWRDLRQRLECPSCTRRVEEVEATYIGTDVVAREPLRLAPVVELPVVTCLPVAVEKVLDGARNVKLSRVLVVGRTLDGEFYFAGSETEAGTLLWDLEKAKKIVMQ